MAAPTVTMEKKRAVTTTVGVEARGVKTLGVLTRGVTRLGVLTRVVGEGKRKKHREAAANGAKERRRMRRMANGV